MTRTRQLGDLGEKWTISLLDRAGFSAVRDLNAIRYNHPGGDFLAEREGNLYFITVKARNKFVRRTRRLNGGYNIFPDKVRRAAKEYEAIAAWLTIQLDTERQCYSAYFGTIESLRNQNAVAVPMSPGAVSEYECLAMEQFDRAITPLLSNQLVEQTDVRSQSGQGGPFEIPFAKISEPRRNRSTKGAKKGGSVSFEDHVTYLDEASLRPILQELRKRIKALEQSGREITEQVTQHQRVAYSVNRIFVEVKVQKKRILVRFFGTNARDSKGALKNIPATHGWQHDKEIAIVHRESLDYAMPFIEASYHSRLATAESDC